MATPIPLRPRPRVARPASHTPHRPRRLLPAALVASPATATITQTLDPARYFRVRMVATSAATEATIAQTIDPGRYFRQALILEST